VDDTTFIREVGERLDVDARRAEAIIFAVFQELRDRLTVKEAGDVAAQLPSGLKRLWRESDRRGRPVAKVHEQEFLGRVRHSAVLSDGREAERVVHAVFGVLQRALGSRTGKEGEAWDVFSVLPKDLKMLWLAAGERAGR
jgi:uncharacterized protein (DUF2267 family)